MPVSAAQISKAILKAKSALGTLLIDVVLKKRTQSTYVPGANVTYVESSYSFDAFVSSYKEDEIDGTMIRAEDLQITMFPYESDPSVIPQPNDVLVKDSVTYRVLKNSATYLGSEIALHVVQVRPV